MPRSTHFDHGYVVGLLVSDRLDSPDDADRLPDVVGATNVKPKFTRLQGQHKHPLRQPEHGAHGMLVSPVPIPAAVMADGHITGDVDASGRPLPDAQPGIWLMAGAHKVDLGGHFASFTIEVTTDHTETNPLDLYAASPYVPPTGSTVQTVLLPANGLPGQVLSRTEDGSLAWVEQTGGGVTDHAALTGRAEPDQHPISSVTGLEDALDGKQPAGNYATNPALTAEAQARQAADSTLSDAIALRQTAEQVDARVQQVVGAAPAALDTLGEIAERLADDADAVSALTSTVAGKADAEHNHDGTYVKPADLPDVSDVVREGDPRLTDDRDPTAHDHDERYYTETESDARFVRTVNGTGPDGSGDVVVSGGGGGGVIPPVAPVALIIDQSVTSDNSGGGNWSALVPPGAAAASPSDVGGTDRIVVNAVTLPACTITGLSAQIVTAAAGATARFGLWAADAKGVPGALVFDSGSLDASTTGWKTVTPGSPLTLTPGIYWLGIAQSDNAVRYLGWESAFLPKFGGPDAGFTKIRAGANSWGGGALPVSLPIGRTNHSTARAPVIYAKVTL